MERPFDFAIIGGGIAGASVAYALAPHGRVILLEREEQPGYHSTGRSAALYMQGYGTAQVRALTRASRSFFDTPPEGFSAHPLLTPRGAVMVAVNGQEDLLEKEFNELRTHDAGALLLDAEEVCRLVPILRRELVIGGVFDPQAADMDVHGIHQGFLRGFRREGGILVCNAQVDVLRRDDQLWTIHTAGSVYSAAIVVNAAGAWVDEVGRMAGAHPLGIEPRRRSAFIFSPPRSDQSDRWPAAIGINHNWYFKPEASMLLGSPANADPVLPHDVQPEEIDVAVGIQRIEEITTMTIRRPARTWAGLRSFVADGDLVGGFDPSVLGLFWVAAQGGYGIQTSPAMAEACAALVRGLPLPDRLVAHGLSETSLSPARLRPSSR